MNIPSAHSGSLYTVAQVRRIEHAAAERCGIAAMELMQRAAAVAFDALRRRWPQARRIVLLAGDGNNGGDAFLLGCLALDAGCTVEALALSPNSKGEARQARAEFIRRGGRVRVAEGAAKLPDADVCVDGLFGIGLTRPIEGVAAVLVERINAHAGRVLALDVPSGLDADSGARNGPCVRADLTVSFVCWKRGLFTADASDACGVRDLASLDLPPQAFEGIDADA